ncbi:hypothetical protein ACFPMF_17405 [Larkinella bovis]|uniref:Uncharacterized protein n=1 Tax=Larkinella bovis TaxID=683041 RepID=A0ABW0IG45_9BACT
MNRKGFLELLQRYTDGTCSPKERQMMDYWYDLLNQEDDRMENRPPEPTQEEMIWTKIQLRIRPKTEPDPPLQEWWQQDS